ncbi:MAG TPA: class I SAM-dependent methyltransferase [Caulobacteraceae bacterium]|jgi:2-polyprenyl-3-methyl-5-hydroxy-6-metoxy-1,4-benzoquinol methylase|nr:class I SAM-dependent methyltransferase [Caulobacteraceae bacterium]
MQGLVETPGGWFEIEPKPSAEALSAYYNDKYYGADDGRGQYAHAYTDEELEHKRLAAAEAEQVWGRPPGRLLEVGFGEGFFLDWFAARGWRVEGIDFTDAGLRAFFPALVDRVTVGDAFALLDVVIARGEVYDLVVCNNVIEHVLDPQALLQRLRRIVAPDGMLRLAAPNDGSWLHQEVVARGLADPAFWVAVPDHLSYFDADTLPRALAANGWTVEELLGEFPIDLFLLDPDTAYTRDRSKGRGCHFARVAFEMGLWKRRSLQAVLEFRRGCARAGTGRNLIAYARPA